MKTKDLFTKNKLILSEKELNWLLHSLLPDSCDDCVWIDNQDERNHCIINNGNQEPCRLFLDRILNFLEKNHII